MNYKRVAAKIRKQVKINVKKSRYEHSKRVAKMCVLLAKRYNLNKGKAYLIGIAHDLCKDYEPQMMIQTAQRDGQELTDFYKNKPVLLHGRAAAVLLKEDYNVLDEELLQAVAVHTSGIVGMNDYSKILLIADKIEPGRKFSTKEYRRELFKLSLDDMLARVLQESFDYVVKKGYEVIPESQKVVEYYTEKKD